MADRSVRVKLLEGDTQLSISTLESQKEHLRALGEGNISLGFRRLFDALEMIGSFTPAILSAASTLRRDHGTLSQALYRLHDEIKKVDCAK
jgi:hypothetical protein